MSLSQPRSENGIYKSVRDRLSPINGQLQAVLVDHKFITALGGLGLLNFSLARYLHSDHPEGRRVLERQVFPALT